MKTIQSLIFAVLLAFCPGVAEICSGQVVAIGHVTAEVIESVSASSQAVTSLTLGAPASAGTLTAGQAATTSPTLNLGTMTVNSGSSATVNVVLKSATLSNALGNGFTLDPSLGTNATASVAQSNGSQNIKLSGTANLAGGQANGFYEGSYTVIFAYN